MQDSILDELWQNWIFRISLSSNELFHSNFLQTALGDFTCEIEGDKSSVTSWKRVCDFARWADLDPAWVDRIKNKFKNHQVFLRREWQNLDLAVVVHVTGNKKKPKEIVLFGVELKIKSYPTREQLQRYIKVLESHNGNEFSEPKLVLLSLLAPLDTFSTLANLKIMNFEQLANGMRELIPSSGTLAAAIKEYVRCCESLHRLSLFWVQQLSPEISLDEIVSKHPSYRRMHPIWSKLCAAYLCELVKKEIRDFPVPDNIQLEPVPGFSNGKWNADFLWSKRTTNVATDAGTPTPKDIIVKVGVQIEGDTLRFMLNALNITHRGTSARRIVEQVLLEQALSNGLYQRLHTLYMLHHAESAAVVDRNVSDFWDTHSEVLMLEGGKPILSVPKDRKGFRLTGYDNSSNFGHADYRLKLKPGANLSQISKIIAKALMGDFNENGHQAFQRILNDTSIFTSGG
ncbi:hypothetical protein GTP23_12730 [Pseudoduganella sp. FT93W]|uniref:Uncharacterized protein n=1 Tax=Duganella fentianensis TaxID=2692177 RepID=A0A845HY18_9BURK|nr:PD-(D/E)XK nuclease family protein [Duganella fentianensis]MYN45913.1 hypothetical protein [Duganella fentianensis]